MSKQTYKMVGLYEICIQKLLRAEFEEQIQWHFGIDLRFHSLDRNNKSTLKNYVYCPFE